MFNIFSRKLFSNGSNKREITDWWFFLQPNGLFGCYDEVGVEIRAFNLTREESLKESQRIADGDSEFDHVELDHEAAVEAALDQLPLPNLSDAEHALSRYLVALRRDRELYGDERIREYVDGLIEGSLEEIEHDRSVTEVLIEVLSRNFGIEEQKGFYVYDAENTKKEERLNEQFRQGSHLENAVEALRVLSDIRDGVLDAQVNPSNWVYDVGQIRMQIERDTSGRINSIALGPKVGDPLVQAGWAKFDIHTTEAGYRIKYYSITEEGRMAQQTLGGAGEVRAPLMDAGSPPKIIAQLPDQIGGDAAYSELAEGYVGPVKMVYRGDRATYSSVFPDVSEAMVAARFAIGPDLGGFTDVQLVAPDPDETVTHETAVSWICE